ncbi:MAG: hypothetical protein ACLQF1_08110 [Methyloceanibacter sp.]
MREPRVMTEAPGGSYAQETCCGGVGRRLHREPGAGRSPGNSPMAPFPCRRLLSPVSSSAPAIGRAKGSTHFAINSGKHAPIAGNPTSTLDYDGMNGNSGEVTWRARNETNTFAKGFVGAGDLSGGSLDDRDFFAGQIKFSDADSSIKGSDLSTARSMWAKASA